MAKALVKFCHFFSHKLRLAPILPICYNISRQEVCRLRKKFKKLLAGILLSVSLFLFAGCSATLEPNSENPLQGQWKDTYGLTEYSFLDDQNLILTTYGFVDFPGTYVLNENGTIEIRYSVLGKEQINTYHFSFNGDRFFLDKNEFVREM